MTLHEAIVKLLKQFGRPMTTTEIAKALNLNKWYQKKDGSAITTYQIHGRTKNYPALFDRNGSTVSLHGQSTTKKSTSEGITSAGRFRLLDNSVDNLLMEKVLMNEKNFKDVNSIDGLMPDEPGLYCIRIIDSSKLPSPFDNYLKNREHNIIYIGIASQSLQKRFLNQELRAKGHGTFFRSIGAVLGFKPPKGSLISKENKKNYKFNKADEQKIIDWIIANLKVNWVTFNGDIESVETDIIQRHLPLLNIAKNPMALSELIELRAECVKIANS